MSRARENSVSRFGVNVVSSALTTLIRMTVLVWVNQYLLRRIAPAEYALVPITTSLMVVVELFPLIFLQGVQRFMVAADAREDQARLTAVVSSMAPVMAALALLVLVAGAFGTIHIETLIRVEPVYVADARIMLALLAGSLALQIGTTPFRVGLNVRMRFVEQNLIVLGTEAFRVALLLALLFGVGPRALWVVVSTTAGAALTTLILIAYTLRILPHARFRVSAMSRATAWELMSFSLWSLIQVFNRLMLRAAPALFLNRGGSAVDVASYQVGNLADMQIRRLVTQSMAPVMPSLTTVHAREGEAPMQNLYYLGGRYYLWVTMFLLPPLMVFAGPLMDLYVGPRYRDAATVMVLLFVAYPFTWANAMFYHIAYATGRVRAFNLCTVATGAAQLAGMIWFVMLRDMGAVGAALGMSAGFILAQLAVMWPFGLKLVGGSWERFFAQTLLRGLAPFAVAAGVCALWQLAFPIAGWLGLGLASLVSAAVYAAVLFGLCLMPQDRDLALRAWRRLAARLPGRKG